MPTGTKLLATTIALLGAGGTVHAADWQHTLTPYLWGSSMSGVTAIGPIEADVDLGFSDILNNLKIGGMLSYRGEIDRWAILVDAIYMHLETDKSKTLGSVRLDATAAVRQTALEADVGYHLNERTLAFAGLRYNDINADLDILRTGPGAGGNQSAGTSESWVDPVVGILTEIPFNDRWSVGLRGDIGGFGVGADFVWQAMVTVRWQVKENMHLIGGYRYLDVDYENGSGTSLFRYDMATAGPGLGLAFTF